jgi:hypothetical protein
MKLQNTFTLHGTNIYHKSAIKTDLKNQVFWNVTLCCWASSQLVQEVFDCLNLKINSLQSFGTSKTTRLTRHNQEDVGLHTTLDCKNCLRPETHYLNCDAVVKRGKGERELTL